MSDIPSLPQTTILSTLLNSDLLRWLVGELIQLWRESRFKGQYEVEEHFVTLELLDEHGKAALYTKRQKMKFLQNDVFAILDQAWGDGDFLADYKCSSAVAVDRYREGFRWKILLSLRGTKNKGDIEEFLIERKIKEGFTTSNEYWQTIIDHPTKSLTLSVVFPTSRLPKNVQIVEENTKHTTFLGQEALTPLSNDRVQYSWTTESARLYEGYILQWEW